MNYKRRYDTADEVLADMHHHLGIDAGVFITQYDSMSLADHGAGALFRSSAKRMFVGHLAEGVFVTLLEGDYGDPATAQPYRPAPESDGFISIYVSVCGNVNYWLDGQKHTLQGKSASILKRSRASTKAMAVSLSGKVKAVSFHFSDAGISRYLSRFSIETPSILRMVQKANDPRHSAIHIADHRVCDVASVPTILEIRDDGIRLSAIMHKLASLLILLGEADVESTSTISSELTFDDLLVLDAIRAAIDANPAAPPSLTSLMEQAKIGRNRLTKTFRALYGQTIRDYCLGAKLNLARALLQEADLTIAEVSDACGYENPNNFIRAFKLRYGHTPGAYRRTS